MTNVKRKQAVILVSVFLIALVMRLAFLGRENLWFDESFTWYAAKMPITDIWSNLWYSARYPPLYYVLMHYVLYFGQSEFILRLPSAVFGALAVPLFVIWGKNITSMYGAWLAAAFLTFSPLTLWYSQEARMYIIVMFLALYAGYSFTVILREPHWIHWVGYIAAITLGIYIHYIMFVLLVILNMVAVSWWLAKPSEISKFSIWQWMWAQSILLILYIPWLPKLPRHWQLTRSETTYPLWILTSPVMLVIFAVGGILSLGALVWLIKNFDRLKKRSVLTTTVTLILLAVFIGLNTLTVINRAATLTRQTLIFIPYLYLGLAILLSTRPYRRYWTTGLLTLTIVAAILNGYLIQKPRWQETSQLIASAYVPGDALVISSPWFAILLDYYSPGDIPVITIRPTNASAGVSALATEYEHTWLVLNIKEERWVDPNRSVRTQFNHQYALEREYRFGLLDVLYFDLHP